MQLRNLLSFRDFAHQKQPFKEKLLGIEILSKIFKQYWCYIWNYAYSKEGTNDSDPDFIDTKGMIFEKSYAYFIKFSNTIDRNYFIDIQQDCQAEICYARKQQQSSFYIVFYNPKWHENENIIYLRETSILEKRVIISPRNQDEKKSDNDSREMPLRIVILKDPLTEMINI